MSAKLDNLLKKVLKGAPRLIILPPEEKPITSNEGFQTLVVYRGAETQIELVIVPPNTTVPTHAHPNVDSYEVYVAGDVAFYLEGHDGEQKAPQTKAFGQFVRVPPGARHGATIGPRGGAFLSIQHWLNGVNPGDYGSVGYDWSGPDMGTLHRNNIK